MIATAAEREFSRAQLGTLDIYNVQKYRTSRVGQLAKPSEIQDAINDCWGKGGGNVYFPKGVYLLDNAPITSTNQGVNPNSQLYLPYWEFKGNNANTQNRSVIHFIGEMGPNTAPGQYYQTNIANYDTVDPYVSGAILKSTYVSNAGTSVSAFPQSIIGSIGPSDAYQQSNFLSFYMQNITVMAHVNAGEGMPRMSGVNMMSVKSSFIRDSNIVPDIRLQQLSNSGFYSVGYLSPIINCEPQQLVDNVTIAGFYAGGIFGEHSKVPSIYTYNCVNGALVAKSMHSIRFGTIASQNCKNAFGSLPQSMFGKHEAGLVYVLVENLNIERNLAQAPTDFNYVSGVSDAGNFLRGRAIFHQMTSNAAVPDNTSFVKSGGVNFKCVSIDQL